MYSVSLIFHHTTTPSSALHSVQSVVFQKQKCVRGYNGDLRYLSTSDQYRKNSGRRTTASGGAPINGKLTQCYEHCSELTGLHRDGLDFFYIQVITKNSGLNKAAMCDFSFSFSFFFSVFS